ncbi:MAG TPA: energy-coupling factor ABC transporter substrate-binding protein [Firmicutes bacterium]|nr:energy-coupling factor ABC transporter substrate-binding protein [Bacillota bacterium]
MKKWAYLLLLCIVVLLVITPLILNPGAEFGGADGMAEEIILTINPAYEPWREPIWEPPSGEIESMLFTLQAVVGSLVIGFFLGKLSARHKSSGEKVKAGNA